MKGGGGEGEEKGLSKELGRMGAIGYVCIRFVLDGRGEGMSREWGEMERGEVVRRG